MHNNAQETLLIPRKPVMHQYSSSAPTPTVKNLPHAHLRSHSASATETMTTVLVGRKRQAFLVNRRLLCAASPFFRSQLQQPHTQPYYPSHSPSPSPVPSLSSSISSTSSPSSYSPSPTPYSRATTTANTVFPAQPRPVTLWLPGESTTMFALFVEHLHFPSSFRSHLDDAAALAQRTSPEAAQLLHWALIRLHLFAAHLDLAALQDLAMDAVQDLYLRCDWDIAPGVVAYLYTRCEARHAVRLRRWAVAMVAFSLTVAWHVDYERTSPPRGNEDRSGDGYRCHQRTASSSSSSSSAVCDPARLHSMLAALPEFAADYTTHLRSMRAAGLDMRFKNPQLRIPANALRNDKRAFGFRECSFHSHRAAVGQGSCPHAASGLRSTDTGSMLNLSSEREQDWMDGGYGVEDDVEDDETGQWEREWADEYLGLEFEGPDRPTTSLRPPPVPPKSMRQMSEATPVRPLVSKFGGYTPRFPAMREDQIMTSM